DRVARSNEHTRAARVTAHLQTVDHAPAVELEVVHPVLRADVRVESVQILLAEELTRKEPRAAQALEESAVRASRSARGRGCPCGRSLRHRRRIATKMKLGVEVLRHGRSVSFVRERGVDRQPAVELTTGNGDLRIAR